MRARVVTNTGLMFEQHDAEFENQANLGVLSTSYNTQNFKSHGPEGVLGEVTWKKETNLGLPDLIFVEAKNLSKIFVLNHLYNLIAFYFVLWIFKTLYYAS